MGQANHRHKNFQQTLDENRYIGDDDGVEKADDNGSADKK